MNELTLNAYAKINLGLDVLRKRPDGYHEVSMIMQTIDLCDEITLTKRAEPGIELIVRPERAVPSGRGNLAWKGAELLMKEFGIEAGVTINLTKTIPVAAGMAGGSSDCAAVLVGINRLFKLGLTREELMKRGVRLGADISYCILGGTALAEGIGERLTPLPPMPDCFLVIAKPAVSISTPFVYQHLRVDELEFHPDIAGMVRSLEAGDLDGIIARLGNVLETAAIPSFPVVEKVKKALSRLGAEGALMSGSGSTVFGIFKKREAAEAAALGLERLEPGMRIIVTCPRTPIADEDGGYGWSKS